jgi:DNA adenine methylase
MPVKFFRYSGAKTRFIDIINSYIITNKKVYCEPFVGSGAVLFNLHREFDKYIINDIDQNIIRIYKTFKEIEYDYYLDVVNFVFSKFGKFTSDRRYSNNGEDEKKNWYNFRNWYNETHWKTDTIDEGIYLHMLANSCINSFLRFSPNGMNSSYGLRMYFLERKNFNKIKNILLRTEIHCSDYKNMLNEDCFFFCDPPYASRNSSYTGFSFEQQYEFIELIKK